MRYSLKGITISVIVIGNLAAASVMAADRFGAIAVSVTTGKFGISTNSPDRASAEAQALKICKASDCAVKATLFNSCGAVASNGGVVSYGIGETQNAAKNSALARIRNGKIVGYGCTR